MGSFYFRYYNNAAFLNAVQIYSFYTKKVKKRESKSSMQFLIISSLSGPIVTTNQSLVGIMFINGTDTCLSIGDFVDVLIMLQPKKKG